MTNDLDARLNDLARMQYGAVGQWRSAELGMSPLTWRRRRAANAWNSATNRFIVSASSPESVEQRRSIALLDAGRGATLSHPTATNIYEVKGFVESPIHVSRPRRNAHTPPKGVTWHHPRLLPDHHVLVVNLVKEGLDSVQGIRGLVRRLRGVTSLASQARRGSSATGSEKERRVIGFRTS